VFEAVANSLNAEQVWQKSDAKARFNLAQNLVQEIAKHHHAGLLQTDLYFKNFLVENDKIYTLDGDGIRKYTRLSMRQTQRNLATLFSKMDVLEDDWIPQLYEAYCAQMGIAHSIFDEAEIWVLTQKIRRQTASSYADRKVFRQCTDVKKYALEGALVLASSDANFTNLPQTFEQIDAYFTIDNLLKSGNTCTVALAEIDDKKVVIKRYNIKSFWHGIGRAFRQTRAAVSWANAHRLKILDIATAKPIALIETRKFGLRGKAYFLAEYIDALDAAQFFEKTSSMTARADAVKAISILFYKLYLLKVSHGDMKATNIKMLDNQPVLLDLDSMQQHRFAFTFEKAHARDLRRFMQNWQNEPALYNAFVQAFKVVYEDDAPLELAKISEN
jgi:tRNA A-37 threonylcarbamoyl transferase component Bud32